MHRRVWPGMALLLCTASLGWAVSAPTKKPAAPPKKPAAAPRRAVPSRPSVPSLTTFEGKVLTVRRGAFPDAQLTLDIAKVGTPVAVKGRGDMRRLSVRCSVPRTGGRSFPLTGEKNIELAGAYYLLPGDRVRGRIRYGERGWTLDSMERLAALGPVRVASLLAELSTDKERYSPGEDIRIRYTVTNRGTAEAVFNFPTGQRFDLMIRQKGRDLWQWSRGRVFTQAISTLTLNPGESMSFRETWMGTDNQNQPVSPGTYTVVGWLAATGQSSLTESSAEVFIEDQPGFSVKELLSSPRSYMNKEITLEGMYRARLAQRGDRLTEGGPPTSRSDWILRDTTGSIYVAGSGKLVLSDADLNRRVRVQGLVRMNPEGRLYIRAWEVTRLPTR